MLVHLLRRIPFVGQLVYVSWKLYMDRRVSIFLKILPPVAFLYVISPIDLLPDFRFGLGQIDDIIVAGILLLLFVIWAPKELVSAYARGGDARPKDDSKTVEADYRYVDSE